MYTGSSACDYWAQGSFKIVQVTFTLVFKPFSLTCTPRHTALALQQGPSSALLAAGVLSHRSSCPLGLCTIPLLG